MVVYPGVLASALHGLVEFFQAANAWSDAEGASFSLRCWLDSRARVSLPDQIQLVSETDSTPHVVVVPPGSNEPASDVACPELKAWLANAAGEGALLASACVGAYVLAESGLLNGRTVTTHWLLADAFRRRFQGVRVDEEQALLIDGDVVTAGGVTAWVDLAVHLVSRLGSPELAMRLSGYFLLDTAQREQRYYRIFAPTVKHGDAPIEKAQRWLLEHHHEPVDLDALSREVGLGARTFQRRFLAATSLAPGAYLQRLRIQQACVLLATTDQSVESVVWSVGYRDISAFRRLFKERVGLTPSAYRDRFYLSR